MSSAKLRLGFGFESHVHSSLPRLCVRSIHSLTRTPASTNTISRCEALRKNISRFHGKYSEPISGTTLGPSRIAVRSFHPSEREALELQKKENKNQAPVKGSIGGLGVGVGGGVDSLRFLDRVGNEPCKGCGATFQCDAPGEVGYVPENKLFPPAETEVNNKYSQKRKVEDLNAEFKDLGLDRKSQSSLICMRCFSLKNNARIEPIRISEDDYKRHLKLLANRKGLIVHVVDMLDIPGSIYTGLNAVVGTQNKIVLCVNKTDMLIGKGKDMPEVAERLNTWIHDVIADTQLKNVVDAVFVSAKSGLGFAGLRKSIEKHRNNGSVYFVGCTNAGKSSVVNKLIADFKADAPGSAKRFTTNVTVSNLPGTTISLIGIPYVPPKVKKGDKGIENKRDRDAKRQGEKKTAKAMIFDTPGIFKTDQLIHNLTYDEIKKVNGQSALAPRTFLLKTGQCLFVGGLAKIELLQPALLASSKAPRTAYLTVFASREINIHATDSVRADEVYAKHAGNPGTNILNIPSGGTERMESFPKLSRQKFRIEGLDWDTCAKDIVMSGIGWVSVTTGPDSPATVGVSVPNGTGLTIRDSLLPEAVRKRGKRVKSRGKRQQFKG